MFQALSLFDSSLTLAVIFTALLLFLQPLVIVLCQRVDNGHNEVDHHYQN